MAELRARVATLPNSSCAFGLSVHGVGFVYLEQNGLFVSAERDGTMNLKPWMEVYERFWLLYTMTRSKIS